MLNSRSLNALNPSPPAISLTPATLPARSRSGTLPSYSSIASIPIVSAAVNGAVAGAVANSPNNPAANTYSRSPLHSTTSHDPLGLPTMDHISLGLAANGIANGIGDIPANNGPTSSSTGVGTSGGRRMRSGSLFSTSSIWNDDALNVSPAILDNASIHSTSSGSFLSPHLSAQQLQIEASNAASLAPLNGTSGSAANAAGSSNGAASAAIGSASAPRNRSYTTTGAIPSILPSNINDTRLNFQSNDMNAYLDAILGNQQALNPGLPGFGADPAASSASTVAPSNTLLANAALSSSGASNLSFAFGAARNRAQTYSGSTPVLQEAVLHAPDQQEHQHHQHHQHQQQQSVVMNAGYSQQQSVHANSASTAAAAAAAPYISLNSYTFSDSPHLEDDFDISKVKITTNFESPSLGPTRFVLFDNLPPYIDSLKLWSILSNSLGNHRSMGSIRSVKLTSLNVLKIALIECSSIEIAMSLKASFNHLELVPGVVIYAAFAKLEDSRAYQQPHQLQQTSQKPQQQQQQQPQPQQPQPQQSQQSQEKIEEKREVSKPPSTDLHAIGQSLSAYMTTLSAGEKNIDMKKIESIVCKSIKYDSDNYKDNFGPLPDPIRLRQFDSPKLRDLKKILDNESSPSPPEVGEGEAGHSDEAGDANCIFSAASSSVETDGIPFSQLQLEELCLAMLDELPELCYDYIGNTVVQKLFTFLESPLIKLMMVKEIAPYLTQLGIHKNGTWAIQKIIVLCATNRDLQQQNIISNGLKPYAVKLFNDQFGNYVLQGCLKFGSPFNDFIFEAILDNFLEISYGRFGARSIRTILESTNEKDTNSPPIVSKEQILLVSGLIVQYANELVVNNNGSLLITWFLESGENDDRYRILSERFLPNLDTLGCHKLASLTILKLINNRFDLKLKKLIMDQIFGKFSEFNEELTPVPSKLLETLLSENPENNAGPAFIYKIISNSNCGLGDDREIKNIKYQNFILLQIRRILLELNIFNMQPYKKLMDEVGLSSTKLNRSVSLNGRRSKRAGRNKPQKNQQRQGQSQSHGHGNGPILVGGGSVNGSGAAGPVQHSHVHMNGGNAYNGGYQYQPQYQPQYPLMGHPAIPQQQQQHQYGHEMYPQQQDQMLMQQLEQLSMSSAKMGYASNPDTPNVASSQRALYM